MGAEEIAARFGVDRACREAAASPFSRSSQPGSCLPEGCLFFLEIPEIDRLMSIVAET
jgi:hypothetical protein